MFQPKYTMNGLEVEDGMKANGSVHSQALRVALTSHLNELQSSLDSILADTIAAELLVGSRLEGNWVELRSFSMAKKVIVAANSLAFFGKELSREPEFLKAALDYPEDLLRTAEILRLMPLALGPFAAPLLMRQYRASKVLVAYLLPLVEARLNQSRSQPPDLPHPKHVDCIQFFVNANSRKDNWSARKIVQVILGVWFASVHQPALSLVYAMDDLCNHPKYVSILRTELATHGDDGSGGDIESLPILDSFLKESARLHPSDSISVRRKVVRPWKFSDGTKLYEGDVACVPLQAIMRDPAIYPDGLTFDASRFLNERGTGNIGRFTDTNPTFPLWGLGKHAW